MPFPLAIPLAISGISALGGLLANRKQQQQTDQTQVQDINQTTLPTYDPKQQIMRDMLMNMYLGRTEDTADYFGGYTRQGLQNINRSANLAQQGISNMLASRGIQGPAAGSALTSNYLNKMNQQSQFLNTIPQLQDQRTRQNLLDAAQFWAAIPTGQTQTGRNVTTTRGTQTQPGNMLGGAFGSLGTTLAGLYGQGAFGGVPAKQWDYPRYGYYPGQTYPGQPQKPEIFE